MLKINVHASYCSTRFGNNVFMNLIGRNQSDEIIPEFSLKQRLHFIQEEDQTYDRIICNPPLNEVIEVFWPNHPIIAFPNTFEGLLDEITGYRTLVLAESSETSELMAGIFSIFACEQTSRPRFYQTIIDIDSMSPFQAVHHFDISFLPFSKQQLWILAIMGANYLQSSPVFRTEYFGIAHQTTLFHAVS